mmetsp:Transcript_88212/g.234562  ORF Transcript_88212/g.234562 Transcript_88212/m.234562 type:complete len:229 (-) Transcript_88212:961-1647(-)
MHISVRTILLGRCSSRSLEETIVPKPLQGRQYKRRKRCRMMMRNLFLKSRMRIPAATAQVRWIAKVTLPNAKKPSLEHGNTIRIGLHRLRLIQTIRRMKVGNHQSSPAPAGGSLPRRERKSDTRRNRIPNLNLRRASRSVRSAMWLRRGRKRRERKSVELQIPKTRKVSQRATLKRVRQVTKAKTMVAYWENSFEKQVLLLNDTTKSERSLMERIPVEARPQKGKGMK